MIKYMVGTMYDKFGVNDLRWSSCRNKTPPECAQGWQKGDKVQAPLLEEPGKSALVWRPSPTCNQNRTDLTHPACRMLPLVWQVHDKSVQQWGQTWMSAAPSTASETNNKTNMVQWRISCSMNMYNLKCLRCVVEATENDYRFLCNSARSIVE